MSANDDGKSSTSVDGLAQRMPWITWVIPCHNEAESIGRVLADISSVLSTAKYPGLATAVIVVDDGSSDQTAAVAETTLLTGELDLTVVSTGPRVGKSAALRAGVAQATSKWIATLDGDGQHAAADVQRAVRFAAVASGDDAPLLVCGCRVARGDSPMRLAESWVANRISAAIFHHQITDTGSGLKVFQRSSFLALPSFEGMHRFLPALMSSQGIKIQSVPITVGPRIGGKSNYRAGKRLWPAISGLIQVLIFRYARSTSSSGLSDRSS